MLEPTLIQSRVLEAALLWAGVLEPGLPPSWIIEASLLQERGYGTCFA